VKARRALALLLFAAGCFGLGLAVARGLGWMSPPAPPPSSSVAPAIADGPKIYIDAGAIELYDGSLTLDPLEPPRAEPP